MSAHATYKSNSISAKLVLILDSVLLNLLTYCQQVWHYFKASDSRKIESLQERGLGVMYKDQQAISLRFSNRNKWSLGAKAGSELPELIPVSVAWRG